MMNLNEALELVIKIQGESLDRQDELLRQSLHMTNQLLNTHKQQIYPADGGEPMELPEKVYTEPTVDPSLAGAI